MSRKKVFVIVIAIVALLCTSFVIGSFSIYGPYRMSEQVFIEPQPIPAPKVDYEESEGASSPSVKDTLVIEDRMVIYNAHISLETDDIDGILFKIRGLAEFHGGYVAGSSRSSSGERSYADITIRVPKDKFQMVVLEIEGYGLLLDESTTSEDVTETYIDLKARLNNLERQEERLQEILTLAKTVEEVLEVEREIERVRGEIESLQGRLMYLERSVAMSLITVRLVEPPPRLTPRGVGWDWRETIETALTGLYMMIHGLIILIFFLIPLIVIGLVIYVVYRQVKKRKQITDNKK